MKQIIQNYRTGALELAEVPVPKCSSNTLLVRTACSLISIGTERSMIELGKKSILGKARARPDLVKRFIEKARKEGLHKTFQEALGRLDNPTALGYSSSGIVIETDKQIQDLSQGDRVACIGANYASHSEYITIPSKLCCKVPHNVSFEEASFGMLGIIALHGIRCANLSFGSSVGVIGLGLLGLLTVQLLKGYGCQVFGIDIDPSKVSLAATLGADYAFSKSPELKDCVERATSGNGIDAVIITAATKSADPVNLAVDLCRFRGKIVLVGVADVHPQRNDMWNKEVEIIVSKAGGPGTFDPVYENKGIDYPVGYLRWTENRNLQEFLRLLSEGLVDLKPLITHRFPIDEAVTAYNGIMDGTLKGAIGVLLTYPGEQSDIDYVPAGCRKVISPHKFKPVARAEDSPIVTAVIGAGLFGKALLLPALSSINGVRLKAIATSSSPSSYHTGKKYRFEVCTTDYLDILNDDEVEAVLILTPHSLHARMVCEALQAGKHVFVEKPLCVSESELAEILKLYNSLLPGSGSLPILMVGYNRRFSPHSVKISKYLENRLDPMVINYRVNVGFVSQDHWIHSNEEGGGRIIGEICHFVDFIQFITGANPARVFGERISGNNRTAVNNDNLSINLKFADGSVGNIVYSASGDKAFSRERIEIFCEGKTLVSTDFKKTFYYFGGKKKSFKTHNQIMGYKEELQHFFDLIKGSTETRLRPEEIFYSTATVFAIHKSLDKGLPTPISLPKL